MKIVLMVEGETEQAFLPCLRHFLATRLSNRMPMIRAHPIDGPLPLGERLRRDVANLLSGKNAADHVIWLSDVYPGRGLWTTAEQAKARARASVGNEPRFHAHVALHDFEAWLLPYWDVIQQKAKSNRQAPGPRPELVNHQSPPSKHLVQVYRTGACRRDYKKPIDAATILRGQDLMRAINACPELKAFVNTILRLSGGTEIA